MTPQSAPPSARLPAGPGGPSSRPRRQWLRRLLASALAGPLLMAACSPSSAPSAAMALPEGARVLAIGDSLTAGQGAARDQSWPAELARLTGWRVENAGRNGDTSAGALARLDGLLRGQAYDAVIIGIGGNDMLHSVPREATVGNIRQMLQAARRHTPRVALLATPLPDIWRASLGHLQDAPFYAELAAAEQALLLPGVYAGVLNQPRLRSDQIHANAQGYAEAARHIREQLQQARWLH